MSQQKGRSLGQKAYCRLGIVRRSGERAQGRSAPVRYWGGGDVRLACPKIESVKAAELPTLQPALRVFLRPKDPKRHARGQRRVQTRPEGDRARHAQPAAGQGSGLKDDRPRSDTRGGGDVRLACPKIESVKAAELPTLQPALRVFLRPKDPKRHASRTAESSNTTRGRPGSTRAAGRRSGERAQGRSAPVRYWGGGDVRLACPKIESVKAAELPTLQPALRVFLRPKDPKRHARGQRRVQTRPEGDRARHAQPAAGQGSGLKDDRPRSEYSGRGRRASCVPQN